MADEADKGCEKCDVREATDDGLLHINKGVLVSVLSLLFFVSVAAGGWVYSYASQAKDVAGLVTRQAALEARMDKTDSTMMEISTRLARMEPLLELLVHNMDQKRP